MRKMSKARTSLNLTRLRFKVRLVTILYFVRFTLFMAFENVLFNYFSTLRHDDKLMRFGCNHFLACSMMWST